MEKSLCIKIGKEEEVVFGGGRVERDKNYKGRSE